MTMDESRLKTKYSHAMHSVQIIEMTVQLDQVRAIT